MLVVRWRRKKGKRRFILGCATITNDAIDEDEDRIIVLLCKSPCRDDLGAHEACYTRARPGAKLLSFSQQEETSYEDDAHLEMKATLSTSLVWDDESNDIPTPRLVFDMTYDSQMTPEEKGGLIRQLTFTAAANRNAKFPFHMVVLASDENDPSATHTQIPHDSWGFDYSQDISTVLKPLSAAGRVIYLTADATDELDEIRSDDTLIVGCVIDHTEKPNCSLHRARAISPLLRVAKLPLDRYVRLLKNQHLPLHACCQVLLLVQETAGDFGQALSVAPAFRCAPLHKYVTWLPPYAHLNNTELAKPREVTDLRTFMEEKRVESSSLSHSKDVPPMEDPMPEA
jgi:hypothetical protein